MKDWHIQGKRVQHVLSGWVGFVLSYHGLEKEYFSTVRFWDDEKKEFFVLECVENELKEPE